MVNIIIKGILYLYFILVTVFVFMSDISVYLNRLECSNSCFFIKANYYFAYIDAIFRWNISIFFAIIIFILLLKLKDIFIMLNFKIIDKILFLIFIFIIGFSVYYSNNYGNYYDKYLQNPILWSNEAYRMQIYGFADYEGVFQQQEGD